ncbi:MAG: acetyl-CoA carboxylase biotin carboxyl carrier protein subunit [Planctomycetota bacterium]
MSDAPKSPARVRRDGDRLQIDVPDEAAPYTVVSWLPPRLVLARGPEQRAFFIAGDADFLWLGHDGHVVRTARAGRRRSGAAHAAQGHEDLSSPMPGKVLAVLVAEGDHVKAGQQLLVVEAMKMESPIRAPHDAVVTRIRTTKGASVAPGETLIELEAKA